MCVGECPFFSLCLCTIHQLIASDTYITFVFLLRLLLCCASWISGAIYLWRAVLIRISTCWTLHENYFRSLGSGVKYLKAASFSMCTNMNYLHFHVSARDIQLPQLNQKHRFTNEFTRKTERTNEKKWTGKNKINYIIMCCECGDCSHFSAWQCPVLLFSTDIQTHPCSRNHYCLSKWTVQVKRWAFQWPMPCSCSNLLLLLATKMLGVNAETHHWYETLMFW